MNPDIFMSYSRREVGFIDDLTNRLEKEGFMVWLDYRSLIPGTSWVEQIEKGLNESEVILLVVSKASLASQYVEFEWRRVLNQNKRIILAIFEAVDLPPELEKFEWVDFRGNYNAGVKELVSHLKSPIQETYSLPQTGFKVPNVVWLTAFVSFVAGIFSLFAIWTILIPLILMPLAWQVIKRNFNFSQVQTALWLLPIGILFNFIVISEISNINPDAGFDNVNLFLTDNFGLRPINLVIYSVLTVIALQLLLRSVAMQRWGKPEATMPKFSNLYRPNNPNPKPIAFHIDHAAQDGLIAVDIVENLTKHGHTPMPDIDSADVVFVLLSRFKTDTEADPEKQIVYPVLIQTAEISEKLSKVQWIDFRKGVRNLDAIAQLLSQPAKMLAALGVRPTSTTQIVMPGIVNTIVNYLIIAAVIDFSSFLSYLFLLMSLDIVSTVTFLSLTLAMILAGVLVFFMIKAITERRGWLASPIPFALAHLGLVLLFGWQNILGNYVNALFIRNGISPASYIVLPVIFAVAAGFFVGIAALFRMRDLLRWFPAKVK